jgi:hypothetical protein
LIQAHLKAFKGWKIFLGVIQPDQLDRLNCRFENASKLRTEITALKVKFNLVATCGSHVSIQVVRQFREDLSTAHAGDFSFMVHNDLLAGVP